MIVRFQFARYSRHARSVLTKIARTVCYSSRSVKDVAPYPDGGILVYPNLACPPWWRCGDLVDMKESLAWRTHYYGIFAHAHTACANSWQRMV